jgi:hypothetical protein
VRGKLARTAGLLAVLAEAKILVDIARSGLRGNRASSPIHAASGCAQAKANEI